MLVILSSILVCLASQIYNPEIVEGAQKPCEIGLVVEDFCVDFCPSEYSCDQLASVPKFHPCLSLDFSQPVVFEDVKFDFPKGYSTSLESQTPDMLFGPRGLFLTGPLSMTLKKNDLILAPSFTISLWVLILKPGRILGDTNSNYLVTSSQRNHNEIELKVDCLGIRNEFEIKKEWKNIVTQVQFKSGGKVFIQTNRDFSQGNKDYLNYWKQSEWSFGKNQEELGFTGFVYKAEVFNWIRTEKDEIELKSCLGVESEDCEKCQEFNCVDKCCEKLYAKRITTESKTCNLFYYLDGYNCKMMGKSNATALIFNMDTSSENVVDLANSSFFLKPFGNPISSYQRGKYLDGKSGYTLDTKLNFGNYLTLVFWVKPVRDYEKMLFNDSKSFVVNLYTTQVELINSTQNTCKILNLSTLSEWTYLAINFLNSTTNVMISYSKSTVLSNICSNFAPDEFYSIFSFFGLSQNINKDKNFKGWAYLIAFSLFAESLYIPNNSNEICSILGFTNTCLWDCDLGEYYSSSNTCLKCPDSINCKSIETTPLCSDSNCTNCINGMGYKCTKCDRYLVDNFCYSECPFTYEVSNSSCKKSSIFAIDSDSSTQFGSTVMNFGVYQPLVVTGIGYYFKPITEVKSSNSFYLSHEYSIMIWFKIANSGTVNFGFNLQNQISAYCNATTSNISSKYQGNWVILRLKKHPYSVFTSEYQYNIYNGLKIQEQCIINTDVIYTKSYIQNIVMLNLTKSEFSIKTDSNASAFVYKYTFFNSFESYDVNIDTTKSSNCPYITPHSCRDNCNQTTYINNTQCLNCSKNCQTCTDGTIYGCTSCQSGKFLYLNLCLDQCPGLYSVSGSICNRPSINKIEWDFNIYSRYTNSTQGKLAFKRNEIKGFQYNRGWYTNNVALENSFQFSHFFGLALWARSDSFIKISRLLPSSQSTELEIKLSTSITLRLNTKSIELPSILNSTSNWSYYSIRIMKSANSTIIEFAFNGQVMNSTSYIEFIFESFPDSLTSISADSPFWILRLLYVFESFDNDVKSYFVQEGGIKCLSYLGFCPSNCGFGYYLNGSDCLKCNGCDNCENGILCQSCKDPLCGVCSEGYNKTCDQCVDGAELSNSLCNCKTGLNAYQSSCILCQKYCTGCKNSEYRGCTQCVKELNSQCAAKCPSLFTEDSGKCSLSNEGSFTVKFDWLNNSFYSEEKLVTFKQIKRKKPCCSL